MGYKMRVALLTTYGSVGGYYHYMKAMYELMKENNYGIRVANVARKNLPFLGPGLTVPLTTLLTNFNEYDIVHNLGAYPFYPLISRRALNVTTAQEFQTLLYPNLNKIQNRTIKDILWYHLVVKPGIDAIFNSDYVFANSMQTKSEAIKLGIPRSKIFLTTLGIDDCFLKPPKASNTGKEFKVGFIGTLSPRKNTPFLVDAFKRMETGFTLELWGKSLYSEQEISGMIGSDKRISVMGPVPDNKIVQTYDSLNAFVFPSLYEGCGLPILEAKARGLPVILHKKGHISQEIKRYCFEIVSGEELAELLIKLKENGYNERLRKKAMDSAREFTWRNTAEKTMSAYMAIDSS